MTEATAPSSSVESLNGKPGRPMVLGRVRFIVNLPQPLSDEVRAYAARERRTLNNSIELLLEQALESQKVDAA